MLGAKAGVDAETTREKFPRLATLPFDPTYKLMATFHEAIDASGAASCVLRQGRRARSDGTCRHGALGGKIPWNDDLHQRAVANMERMEGRGQRVMAAAFRDLGPRRVRRHR